MSSSISYDLIVRAVYVEEDAAESLAAARIASALPRVPITQVSDQSAIPESDRTGTTIYLHTPRGAPVTRCPGTRGHRCCNYLTIDLYSGCPIGCSYCIMRSYLNFSPVSVVSRIDEIADEIRSVAHKNPDTMIRVGSGETGDSLLYDPIFGLSRELIEAVADIPNVYFEMKTKTDFVDHLLDIPDKGRSVVGFSLAPQPIVDAEEGAAASLTARLNAAERASRAGYLVSFHFDPMFYRPDWRELYLPVARRLSGFSRVAWISLGTFRYPGELKEFVGTRKYLYGELVRSQDGKFRYLQRIRREMYAEMRKELLSVVDAPVYLCMESEAVWKRGFGALPEELPAEKPLFEWPDF